MNQPRCRRLLTSSESESDCKRARIDIHGYEETIMLNECGISNLAGGKDEEAERCFMQALLRAGRKFRPTEAKSHDAWSFEDDSLSVKKLNESELMPVDHLTPSSASMTRETYIYQRHEYDEGMHTYSEPLQILQNSSDRLRSSTLLYNMGQTSVRRRNYLSAIRWFQQSLLHLRYNGIMEDDHRREAAAMTIRNYHNIGHCLYRLGRNDMALSFYRKGLALTQEVLWGELHEIAAMNCIGVLLFHQNPKQSDEAQHLFKDCLKVLVSLQLMETREAATVLNNIGRVYYVKGELKEALSAYEDSLCRRRQLLGPNSIDVAATVSNMGQTYHQCGELDTALTSYKEFLKIAPVHLWSKHRDISLVLKSIGEIHHERREFENARAVYKIALDIGREALGEFHAEVASVLNRLGNLHYEQGDMPGALNFYEEGLKVEKRVFAFCHPHIVTTMCNIAQIYRQMGDLASALCTYDELHNMQVSVQGVDSLDVANTLSNMAFVHNQQQRYALAFEYYQEALRIQRDHYKSDNHSVIASTLNSIGLVLFHDCAYKAARDCFLESLRIRRKVLGPEHADVATSWYNIATVHLEMGEDDVAIDHYKESLRVERQAHGGKHNDVILTLQHLGLVHQQRGELEDSLRYFTEALDLERESCGSNRIAVAKLLNLIGNIHLQRANITNMMECYSEATRTYRDLGCARGDSMVIAGYNFYGLARLHPPSAPAA